MDNLPGYTSGVSMANYLRPDISVGGQYSVYGTITRNAQNWLVFTTGVNPYPNTNYGSYMPWMAVPYQNISDFSTRRSFFGFRIQVSSNTGGPYFVVQLKNSAATSQNLLLNTQLAANTSQFVEIMFDRANTLIVVWVDGVQVSSTFFDFNAFVAADGVAGLYFAGNANLASCQFRDFYFLDDTQDATLCDRLGPVDVRASALSAVSAPNWVSSDSQSALTDLSTVLGTTTPTLNGPTLTEPPSMDPLTFNLSNANLVPGERILAVKADISAQRNGGYVYAPQITVGYNGQTANGKKMTYPVPSTLVFNQNAFLMEKAPDNTVWTPQAVAAAVATLTP
ncbi:hypothetical protein [Burkholderia phage FLC9]|nr:hypothetical protein [Burkholderia phage FLC9]